MPRIAHNRINDKPGLTKADFSTAKEWRAYYRRQWGRRNTKSKYVYVLKEDSYLVCVYDFNVGQTFKAGEVFEYDPDGIYFHKETNKFWFCRKSLFKLKHESRRTS